MGTKYILTATDNLVIKIICCKLQKRNKNVEWLKFFF